MIPARAAGLERYCEYHRLNETIPKYSDRAGRTGGAPYHCCPVKYFACVNKPLNMRVIEGVLPKNDLN